MRGLLKSNVILVTGMILCLGLLILGLSGSVPVWGNGSLDHVESLGDNYRGHPNGWDPPNVRFKIKDSFVHPNSVVIITINQPGPDGSGPVCSVTDIREGVFIIGCTELEQTDIDVPEGSFLNYAVLNP